MNRRFVEYSLSASLMLCGICLISGLRERAALISIFMLSFTTMICGIMVELYSRPETPDKWKDAPDPPDLDAIKNNKERAEAAKKFRNDKLKNYLWYALVLSNIHPFEPFRHFIPSTGTLGDSRWSCCARCAQADDTSLCRLDSVRDGMVLGAH